ncbi:MAG: FHA domain-containing protein [Ignavibacteriales bacterium]|jgi:FOG: FHA domain|nr:MAG: FHA domain-containing protein [Ignavibacteriaceae bacterium]MBW7873448.1 FHA domain-containing protein [Ignavibacteria bacterium]MCZ2142138.1 FHA domain-containing protein [Ignavibacteriales bacterium]OQY76971.1 MAG: hypothetical protein B6D45_03230 [Ignavibacteriales bacterium UTCHB3]MBV6444875.1 hypothetical protein [Ignavibacteriaceae bacterium]
MKCPECGKETPSNKSHCQECGAKLNVVINTCSNGHQYTGDRCPYCPPEESLSGAPTVLEESPVAADGDRTVIDTSAPVVPMGGGGGGVADDRTQILTPNQNAPSPNFSYAKPQAPEMPGRKIVGFLVTYDLNPLGTVFNLYEGRNLIGRVYPAAIQINNSTVSDKHALILYRDDKFQLADELSTNGTYHNGVSVDEKVKLSDRDEIRFGEVKTKFIII